MRGKDLKLDEALLAMVNAGEPAFELNGQCFDCLVQAIENRHYQLVGEKARSRRLGDLQAWLETVEQLEVHEGFKALRKLGKTAVSDFYPEQIVGEEFVRATVSWLQMTGWELPVYVPRIRYAPLEINQTGFDRGQPKPPPPFRAGAPRPRRPQGRGSVPDAGQGGQWVQRCRTQEVA